MHRGGFAIGKDCLAGGLAVLAMTAYRLAASMTYPGFPFSELHRQSTARCQRSNGLPPIEVGFRILEAPSDADEATLIFEARKDIRLVFWLKIGRGGKGQVATHGDRCDKRKRIRSAQPDRMTFVTNSIWRRAWSKQLPSL
jgi:hypothetical protein